MFYFEYYIYSVLFRFLPSQASFPCSTLFGSVVDVVVVVVTAVMSAGGESSADRAGV